MTPRFRVDDRVLIAEGHPWGGYAGTVREIQCDRIQGLRYVVEVDGQYGQRSIAYEEELTVTQRTTEGD